MSCFGKSKKGDKKKSKVEKELEVYRPAVNRNEGDRVIAQQIISSTTTTTKLQTVEKSLNISNTVNGSTSIFNRTISTNSNGSRNATVMDAVPFQNIEKFRSAPLRSAFFSEPLTTRPNMNFNSPRWGSGTSGLFDRRILPPAINDHQRRPSCVEYDTQVLREKINIKVTKTGKFYDNLPNNKVPVYSTHSKFRGRVLLINNIKFIDERTTREGAEFDELNVTRLFDQMGFIVTSYRDLSKKDMENRIIAFRNDNRLKRVDIGTIIVMSHGKGNERSDSTEVACTDGQLLETSWIINQFSNDQCPNLSGKPKIFIFQCCRGKQIDIQVDAAPFSSPRQSSDMLIGYSTVPGFVSHRDPKTGTWYIQAICRIFMEHAHDTDVENLLKMVDHSLSQLLSGMGSRQTSSFENRGFKTCFLHP